MQKLLVIGNCQARPLGAILRAAAPELHARPPIILHLAQTADRAAHEAAMEEADLIVAQATAQTFAVPHLSSATIRQVYAGKVVVWPNLFFSGQQPFLRYVTHKTAGRLAGPLEALHDLRILRDWMAARGEHRLDQIDEPGYVARVTASSLAEIEGRETSCDVRIADLIAAEYRTRRLFYTFNHPSNWLLERLAERILLRIGRSVRIDQVSRPEYLARYVTPSIWMDLDTPNAAFQGTDITFDPSGKVTPQAPRGFASDELRAAFHACYDRVLATADLSAFRFTPAY